MLNHFAHQIQALLAALQTHFLLALKILSVFWIVYFVNKLLSGRLNFLGIYPRRVRGLPGIFCAPFLHADFKHLLFNAIPLLLLIDFILIGGFSHFLQISLWIIGLSGVAVWLLGRKAVHIGASGLIMGYWGYLLMNAYHNPSVATILIALLCLYYLGGLVLSLFPSGAKVSWEGHVFGFVAGILVNYFNS